MVQRFAIAALLVTAFLALPASASAYRDPTPEEATAITALPPPSENPDPYVFKYIQVSTAGPWAVAKVVQVEPYDEFALYRGSGAHWKFVVATNRLCADETGVRIPRPVQKDLRYREECHPTFVRDTTRRFKKHPRVLNFAFPALFPPIKVTGIHWRNWNGWFYGSASGRGRLHYDTCVPDCATGKYRKIGARVTLWRIGRCRGRDVFTRIDVDPNGPQPVHTHKIECSGYLL